MLLINYVNLIQMNNKNHKNHIGDVMKGNNFPAFSCFLAIAAEIIYPAQAVFVSSNKFSKKIFIYNHLNSA